MIDDRPLSADRVPTLTEVVELGLPMPPAARADGEHDTAPRDHAAVDAPQGMADDFVLAGLETDAVVIPAETDGAALAPAAGTPPSAVHAGERSRSEADAVPDNTAQHSFAATVEFAQSAGPEMEPEGPLVPSVALTVPVQAPLDEPAVLPPPGPAVDTDAVVGQVLSELMPRIDMLLESRLREALAPALARAADGLIRDTRANLAVAVRDLVQEAVDRALQRRADL